MKKKHKQQGFSGNLSSKTRKIPQQNIVLRLRSRETHPGKPNTHYHLARSFHQNVFPNFTVVNVEKPPCFLRKFSPDGRFFIAFSSEQTSLEIYEYQGPAAAEALLKDCYGEYTKNGNDQESVKIRTNIFKTFFKLLHTVSIASEGEQLNRECSLFTDNGRYVIVGSASTVPDEPHPLFFNIYRNNESVGPNSRSPLEDYTLHSIDMVNGVLVHKVTFKIDKIFLSHNQGIYLYRSTLAVLSVQQQTIHIFQISPEGHFVSVRNIGRHCYDNDNMVILPEDTSFRPFREATINALKHRVLVHLYRQSLCENDLENGFKTSEFFRNFEHFRHLKMWKMQLLDEEHILIKYASEQIIVNKTSDPNSQLSFFVVYNMVTTKIIAIYENTSDKLLDYFEKFCDLLRNVTLHWDVQFTCSSSTNLYARENQQNYKATIINARFGGHTEAVKRLLSQLPISSQSYSSSPYLDLSLFSYDDKWVSVLERPKSSGDYPIRFYARDSALLKFKIHAGVLGRTPPPSARRLVAFTFHPHDPFAVSVQRTNSEYIVNFHVRHFPQT